MAKLKVFEVTVVKEIVLEQIFTVKARDEADAEERATLKAEKDSMDGWDTTESSIEITDIAEVED